ncbi:hypothetical protein ABPG74_003819 [Tetrahymena malaccensis]
MNTQISQSIKRGIALFGNNFVLPFENQTHLSNCLSIQYLQFCQKYNSTNHQKQVLQNKMKQTITTPLQQSSIESPSLSHSISPPKYYDYLVLAPRKVEDIQLNNQREYYDIATIVTLQKCTETGAIIALSKGVDSLVRIKKSGTENRFAAKYTSCNRLIVENDPHIRNSSIIKASDLPFVVKDQRKLFFCDYETIHNEVPKYSEKEKEHFVRAIYDLAQKTNLQNFSQKEFLEDLAADPKSSMFPRLQLFQILKHLDYKYYFNRDSSEWLDQKYEILKAKNDEQILQFLHFVQKQLTE